MPRRNRIRIVIDTNVVVSGIIFPESFPGRVLTSAESQCLALCSRQSAAELLEELGRPKFDKWIVPEDRMSAAERFLEMCGRVVPVPQVQVCRDEADNRLLEVALTGHAEFVVSGDADLLELGAFESTRILSPREFCDLIEETREA